MRYRNIPIEIEAIQWDGTKETAHELVKWGDGKITWWFNQNILGIDSPTAFGGNVTIDIGDWVIKTPKGAIMVCKRDVFDKTYEKIE